MSARAFQILKFAGAIYLLYLAWGMWRDTGSLKLDRSSKPMNAAQIVLKGILINILNPKLTMFFFAFLPLFVSAEAVSPTQQMIVLSAIFMGMTFFIFALYGSLASWISTYLISSPKAIRWMQRSFAVVFAILAAKLALSKQ